MVLTTEDFGGGGGWSLFGNNATTKEEDTLEDLDIEQLTEWFDKIKKYLPFAVIVGLALAWTHIKKK